MIKNVFYDLDGTLLPMSMDEFMAAYFGEIVKKMAKLGKNVESLADDIWKGTKAMVKNDGTKTNEDAFWDCFCEITDYTREDIPVFQDYYENEFDNVRKSCGYNEKVPKLIETVKNMGLNQVLATNPLFPDIATAKRIKWAGLDASDFITYTTYENCHYCKPNTEYYRELLDRVGMKAEETLMIGNDVEEDMIASKLGMKVFLVTDCVLNPKNRDLNEFPNGDFDAALEYIKECAGQA